ncbi:alpha-D-xyloside xylohydrolase [Micromonospora pattaloongensis]|uniref:alpha-D-xyloside xylohydrolase n=1 Tax=Micromonospora pattaloongensis TaxID=405436 RepID=A0A1H3RST4_9ACTN|nr:alpha-xylosidase [Micromonospora pattaloongensis]SDZ28733.1 alpha-D-xyloside xylohydrolase [Micromonospora pattaloongensis]
MKFSDGYWHMRPGVRPLYPAEVHDVAVTPESLTVYAPTARIGHRGDTLNRPMVTVECRSPMPDVIAVTVAHFLGGRPRRPAFPITTDPGTAVRVAVDDDSASLTSGALTARFDRRDGWRLEFLAGDALLTASGSKAMAVLDTDAGGPYVREQLRLGVGECVYGLGERFGPLVKNGQEIDIWNADGGTSSEQAYKNIPFYLTNRGYGVFVNHPGRVSFEVGSEAVSRVQFSVAGQALEYLLIYGPSPAEILRKYTALTGRPALPPPWSFGLWLSTSFTTSYDEPTVLGFVDGMAERDLPLSVFHFDTFWMREFHWSDFEWDPRAFPDPPAMLKRLKDRGLRICVWINPYIAQRSALFAEGMAHGYLVRRPDGDVWQWDQWQAGMALVDFTDPHARRWYADKLRALLEMGVDCFKSDFGERIPTDVVWSDGADPERMHNYYSYLYNETVFEVLRAERGEGEAVVFARAATAGGQRFPVHWGGDSESTFESMAETLRGGLSLAMSGFGFWSHDIGGFEGRPAAEVFKRWLPFGLLSSHSRLHGSQSYRVPWLFDAEAVEVLRRFTRLKARLMPYLFGAAVTAHREGIPVLRPTVFEFPDDPAATHLDRQYLLGDRLLVAPVFTATGETSYYLPAGRWTHLLTGEVVAGPRWVRETCGFDSIPVYVRPGTVLPVGARDDRPDYPYADGVTLRVYELADGQAVTVRVPAADGSAAARFEVRRDGDRVRARRDGPANAWALLLVNTDSVRAVEGGASHRTESGVRVDVAADVPECVAVLPTDPHPPGTS